MTEDEAIYPEERGIVIRTLRVAFRTAGNRHVDRPSRSSPSNLAMRRNLHTAAGGPAPRNHGASPASLKLFVSVCYGHRCLVKSTVYDITESTTDREVPIKMAFQALTHSNRGDYDICFIRGSDNVRVRLLCEIKDLRYRCVRKLGLKDEDAMRGEDSGRPFGALGRALG